MSEPTTPIPHILQAERLENGVVIEFDDGRCALYSESLLYAMFAQAIEILPGPEEIEESN